MELPEAEARRRLAGARVARLATAGAAGVPHLVPVTFAVRGGLLATAVDGKPKRHDGLRRLRNAEENARVCVLADAYEEDWSRLWWVRADCLAAVARGDARRAPLAWLAAKYPQYRERPPAGPVLVLTVTRCTGWSAQR